MINFKKSAQKTTTLSELMIDRDKLTTEEIIEEGGKITIIDIEPTQLMKPNGKVDETWVYVTKEYPNNFSFAGLVLKRIFDGYLKEYEGDVSQLRNDFTKAGGLEVQLSQGTTKGSNNDITLVEII